MRHLALALLLFAAPAHAGSVAMMAGGGIPRDTTTELWESPANVFTSGVYGWNPNGTNTIANVGGELEVTYVGSTQGAYVNLTAASDLNTDMIALENYRLILDAYVNCAACVGSGDPIACCTGTGTGCSSAITVYTGTASVDHTVTECTATSHTIDFTKAATGTATVRQSGMGAAEKIYLDNLSLKLR